MDAATIPRIDRLWIVLTALFLVICAAPVQAAATDAVAPGVEWQRLLGGNGTEESAYSSVQQTADGGYILVGYSESSTSGDVTGTNHGNYDLWVVKLDGIGAIQWQQLLGGSGFEEVYSVKQTDDGGCVILGSSRYGDGDTAGESHGGSDFWVVKLDSTGAIQWQRLLGGRARDIGIEVCQTPDGGYILVGDSESSASGDVTGTNHGAQDIWVAKLNGTGAIEWERLLGGSNWDFGGSITPTSDGGYILLGVSFSYDLGGGDTTSRFHGICDLWVVKLNATGAIQWQRLLGGSEGELGNSIQQTADGGYILLGFTESSRSGDVADTIHAQFPLYGNCLSDLWVVKLDDRGAIQWQRLLGGWGVEQGYSIQQTTDGGYVLLGDTNRSKSGDVTGTLHGSADAWVVKLDSTGAIQWQMLLGGSGYEEPYSVQQTADGGYILAGESTSNQTGDVTGINHGRQDLWVVKLGSRGVRDIPGTPGGRGLPRDSDGDDKYEDVNGNGRVDFSDVVLYFNQIAWIAANEPVSAFDYNGNGSTDFADVVWLFNNL